MPKDRLWRRLFLTWLPAVGLALAVTGCGHGGKPGCSKDRDCKGERICVSGTCREPHPDRKPGLRAPSARAGAASQGAAASGSAGARSRVSGPGSIPGSAHSSSPGSGLAAPGGVFGKPDLQIKVCRSGRCTTFGPQSGPGSLMQLMDLFMQMGMGSLGGMSSVPRDLTVQVCSRGRCVSIGKDFGKDPADVMRLMDLVTSLMGGMGLSGANSLFGMGRPGGPGTGGIPGAAPSPQPAPPRPQGVAPGTAAGPTVYHSLDSLRKAGPAARGKVAELAGLSISSVSPGRAVFLAGGGGVLVILRIQDPTVARKLQTVTRKVTVRFQVDSVVSGSLIQGTLLKVM